MTPRQNGAPGEIIGGATREEYALFSFPETTESGTSDGELTGKPPSILPHVFNGLQSTFGKATAGGSARKYPNVLALAVDEIFETCFGVKSDVRSAALLGGCCRKHIW